MGKVNAFAINVYRHEYDFFKGTDTTNGGVSGRYNTLYLEDPYGTESVDADDERLVQFVKDAGWRNGWHLEPVNGHKGKAYTDWELGGNIAEVTRAGETEYFRIHDRQDTWEDYEALSR